MAEGGDSWNRKGVRQQQRGGRRKFWVMWWGGRNHFRVLQLKLATRRNTGQEVTKRRFSPPPWRRFWLAVHFDGNSDHPHPLNVIHLLPQRDCCMHPTDTQSSIVGVNDTRVARVTPDFPETNPCGGPQSQLLCECCTIVMQKRSSSCSTCVAGWHK